MPFTYYPRSQHMINAPRGFARSTACMVFAVIVSLGMLGLRASAKPLHHFVFYGQDREAMRTDELFLKSKVFEGAQITYSWRQLERGKDGYDFSDIRDDLKFLASHQ